jgi:hypothetical protein
MNASMNFISIEVVAIVAPPPTTIYPAMFIQFDPARNEHLRSEGA